MSEQELHSGMLQVLKWAMESCSPDADGQLPTHETIYAVIKDGSHYEAFVDALKMANHDRVEIGEFAIRRLVEKWNQLKNQIYAGDCMIVY